MDVRRFSLIIYDYVHTIVVLFMMLEFYIFL
jgi:hypothetical protein